MTFNHDFNLFILIFFFPLCLGGKRKDEKNNQSRGQKVCLSARLANLCIWGDGVYLKGNKIEHLRIMHITLVLIAIALKSEKERQLSLSR